ncbi:type II secretion system protein [Massilia sp. Bi118]|uniref:type II secretion system protein n=1 Tax=Massilia sp. Bi118 TaxID=2822346 RepID=UPI001E52AFA4|nr:type II secretion system protein [Massilia sp. Bi118]
MGGFTYVGLIVLVAIIGLVGAATLKADALLRRAAAEEELLEIGAAFSAALTSYAEATPRGQPTQPPSLEELLKDPRVPGVRRHLRKIFVDPITGKAEWGIVWLNKGTGINGSGGSGVLAVYSLSQARPLKQANFDARFQNLENREHLADWKFAATGKGVAQGQIGQPGQGQPGQPGLFGQPGQPATGQPPAPAPSDPPSLFPGRGNPGTMKPSPAEPPPPEPAQAPPEKAEQPEAPEPPQQSEDSGSGDDEKDARDERERKDKEARDANRR